MLLMLTGRKLQVQLDTSLGPWSHWLCGVEATPRKWGGDVGPPGTGQRVRDGSEVGVRRAAQGVGGGGDQKQLWL